MVPIEMSTELSFGLVMVTILEFWVFRLVNFVLCVLQIIFLSFSCNLGVPTRSLSSLLKVLVMGPPYYGPTYHYYHL